MKIALQNIKPGDGEELSLDAITLAPGSRDAAVLCLVAQSCQTLCNPMDYSPPCSSVHGDSLGKNTGVGCHDLLQGIFLTQGSNLRLLNWQADALQSEPLVETNKQKITHPV